ncbi:unnamed protein product [Caenorhabditis brenneri]
MVTHTDYPHHGEIQLNFPDQLRNGEIVIDLVSVENEDEWTLQINSFNTGDGNTIFVSLSCPGTKHVQEFRVHYYLGFLNHKDKSKSDFHIERLDSRTKCTLTGIAIPESEVQNKENGWLKDGKLTAIFGIHTEAFKETIWKFNCYEPNFRHLTSHNTLAFIQEKDLSNKLFSHKQLLMHHFPFASTMYRCVSVQDYFNFDSLEKCLQILNGTRITTGLNDLLNVLKIARHYKLYNVIRYCEMELIQRKDEIKFIRNHIQFATHYKLSRYLACALRDLESPEAVKEEFRHVDIDSMTGEMMKQCVMYLLSFY